jgi:hypothetical protein
MPEGEPISHAEMIATVRQIVLDADDDPTPPTLTHDEVAILSAVLRLLERTQPTDTQADAIALRRHLEWLDEQTNDGVDFSDVSEPLRRCLAHLEPSPETPR